MSATPQGLFDLPSPWLLQVDRLLDAHLAPPWLVAFWGLVAAVLCLELYRLVSPQAKIGRLKTEAGEVRRELSAFDGDMDEAWPLLRANIFLPFKRLCIVLPATLLAALPVLVLLVYLSGRYGYDFPSAGDAPAIEVAEPYRAHWQAGDPPQVVLGKEGSSAEMQIPVLAPSAVLHKRQWWNALVANPAGYLDADAPVDSVQLALPKPQLLPWGPVWLRGWDALFITVLFVAALAYKTLRGIK